MATGGPNEHGIPERPAPDESLWLAEEPLGPNPTVPGPPASSPPAPRPGTAYGTSRPAGGIPAKRSTGRDPETPAVAKRPAMLPTAGPATVAPLATPLIARAAQAGPLAVGQAIVSPRAAAEDDNSLNILIGLAQNAPAWLISAVVHTSLLIILGVCLAAVEHKPELEPPGINLSDQIGEALEGTSLESGPGTQTIENVDSKIFTPQNLPHVEDPFATPPLVSDIRMGGMLPTGGDLHAPTVGLALHGRSAGMKGALLGAYGGNGTTESAVGRGLEWLAKQQGSSGMWSLSGPYSDHAIRDNEKAATAMALLAFQGAGITPGKGKYADAVKRAWTALLKTQGRDGSFGNDTPDRNAIYTHAQCTIALCEVFSMTQDNRYYEPAQRAVDFCVATQDKKGGGWRYSTTGTESDTSVTGWVVMALKSAQMARLNVPSEVFDNVNRYLDSAALPDGNYAYAAGLFATPAVTAEAYLCRQLLGWKQDDPRLIDGCKLVTKNLVAYEPAERDVYCWYYATQVCHNMEGQIWDTWNTAMRTELPEHQEKGGAEAGSWDPKGDRWGSVAGRLYTTCLSIYMLEVYYRHLPIYSAYKYGAK